jgi:hypothetical protein
VNGVRRRLPLLAVLAFAVVVRVVWCVYAARPPAGLHDPGLYRMFADQFARGEGYYFFNGPTAYYPVGYPLVLGGAFLLTPAAWETGVVAALNIVCQVVSVALVYAITRRLLDGREVPALVAAIAVAAWPNLVLNTAVALTESLFIALLLGSVAIVVAGPWDGDGPPRRNLVGAGVLFGASVLVRPVSLPMLGGLLVAWLVARAGWRRAIVRTAAVALAAAAVVLPWMIRNAIVVDAVVLSTNTGDNLCMSRRVGGTGAFEFPNLRCFPEAFNEIPRPESEVRRDDHGTELAVEFIREHPAEEVRLWGRRLWHALHVDDDGVAAAESYGDDPFLGERRRDLLQAAANGWYYVVGGAGAAGLVVLATRRRPAGVFVALATPALLVSVVAFFGDPRFKQPVLPFLAIGVGVLVDAAAHRRRRQSAAAAPAVPAVPDPA